LEKLPDLSGNEMHNSDRMIKLLQRKVVCVCEIKEALDLAQSTVSKHLKILEEAGLVNFTKDGFVWY
jgi:ArsR family transcriptional regulator, arsenate/arsenite/antimonite-responsive transcriptional repressor